MKIETRGNFLELDFDASSPSAHTALIMMVEVLNSKELISTHTILKVKGLDVVGYVNLTSILCVKLGYIFRVCALDEDGGGRYIVHATLNVEYPVGSEI